MRRVPPASPARVWLNLALAGSQAPLLLLRLPRTELSLDPYQLGMEDWARVGECLVQTVVPAPQQGSRDQGATEINGPNPAAPCAGRDAGAMGSATIPVWGPFPKETRSCQTLPACVPAPPGPLPGPTGTPSLPHSNPQPLKPSHSWMHRDPHQPTMVTHCGHRCLSARSNPVPGTPWGQP